MFEKLTLKVRTKEATHSIYAAHPDLTLTRRINAEVYWLLKNGVEINAADGGILAMKDDILLSSPSSPTSVVGSWKIPFVDHDSTAGQDPESRRTDDL
jgi:hypothetical protein